MFTFGLRGRPVVVSSLVTGSIPYVDLANVVYLLLMYFNIKLKIEATQTKVNSLRFFAF